MRPRICSYKRSTVTGTRVAASKFDCSSPSTSASHPELKLVDGWRTTALEERLLQSRRLGRVDSGEPASRTYRSRFSIESANAAPVPFYLYPCTPHSVSLFAGLGKRLLSHSFCCSVRRSPTFDLHISGDIRCIFRSNREKKCRDHFAPDCVHHQGFSRNLRDPGGRRSSRHYSRLARASRNRGVSAASLKRDNRPFYPRSPQASFPFPAMLSATIDGGCYDRTSGRIQSSQ